MRNGLRFSGVLCLCAGLLGVSARAEHFQIDGKKISLEVPKGWTALGNDADAPFLLTAPTLDAEQTTLGLLLVSEQASQIDLDDKDQATAYEKERRASLKEESGEALEFFPYRRLERPTDVEVYSTGVRYKQKNREYAEKQYFIHCRSLLFMAFELSPMSSHKQDAPEIDKILRSFTCVP